MNYILFLLFRNIFLQNLYDKYFILVLENVLKNYVYYYIVNNNVELCTSAHNE